MFKKNDNAGDKTLKQENKENVSKEAIAAKQPAPAPEVAGAPAKDAKKA